MSTTAALARMDLTSSLFNGDQTCKGLVRRGSSQKLPHLTATDDSRMSKRFIQGAGKDQDGEDNLASGRAAGVDRLRLSKPDTSVI